MKKPNTKNLVSMGRRRFLSTLAGIGISATTLGHITKQDLVKATEDPTKEVPYVEGFRNTGLDENGEVQREPVYATIPRERWVKIEATLNAANRLSEKLDYKFVSAGMEKHRTRNRTEHRVKVRYKTYHKAERDDDGNLSDTTSSPNVTSQAVEEQLPDKMSGIAGGRDFSEQVKGIPVIFEEADIYETWYENKYRPVPGGCAVSLYKDLGLPNGTGSVACRAKKDYGDYGYVLLTCGHIIDGKTETIGQPDATAGIIGTVGDYTREPGDSPTGELDFGYIEPQSDVSLTDELAAYGGEYMQYPIAGTKSWDWIKNDGTDVYRKGKATGQEYGNITSVDNENGEKHFYNSANCDSGDSGGVHYTLNEDNLESWIVGIQAWGSGSDGDEFATSSGNAIGRVEQEYNVYVF